MGKVANHERYAVITADIVNSRKIEKFRPTRDRYLTRISKLHLDRNLILSPYAITAWDEFQVILRKAESTPRAILDLRRIFYPLQLWIAVGIGEVTEPHKSPINQYAGGPAFERARQAADRLKKGFSKYRILTNFQTGEPMFDTIANAIYQLQDTILEGTTEKQWSAMNAQMDAERLDLTAKKLGLDISTVSRHLKRGHFWQLIDTAHAMEKIISVYF